MSPSWKASALNEYLPLKQGLRHNSVYEVCFWALNELNEYLPLKQGLRPCLVEFVIIAPLLNEYLPLKQGLRLLLQ